MSFVGFEIQAFVQLGSVCCIFAQDHRGRKIYRIAWVNRQGVWPRGPTHQSISLTPVLSEITFICF